MTRTTPTLAELTSQYPGWNIAEAERDEATVYTATRRHRLSRAALRFGMSIALEAATISMLADALAEEAKRTESFNRHQDIEPPIGVRYDAARKGA